MPDIAQDDSLYTVELDGTPLDIFLKELARVSNLNLVLYGDVRESLQMRFEREPLANLLLNDVQAAIGTDGSSDLATSPLSPARAIAFARLLADGAISSRQGKEVLAAILAEDKDPDAIVEERDMKQVSDVAEIEAVVDAVLAANPVQVGQYRAGKKGILGFLVGQCMKATGGQGNPRLINRVLMQKLDVE